MMKHTLGKVGRLYVCTDCTCARKRAVYCSLQLAGQGEKKKNGSHQGILVNWERIGGGVTDDCWEAADARYHPTILQAYR